MGRGVPPTGGRMERGSDEFWSLCLPAVAFTINPTVANVELSSVRLRVFPTNF